MVDAGSELIVGGIVEGSNVIVGGVPLVWTDAEGEGEMVFGEAAELREPPAITEDSVIDWMVIVLESTSRHKLVAKS